MAKTSLQKQKNTSSENNNKNNDGNTKVKRTRKTVPRNSALQRSSIYRGVTRHRWTGRYEAHLWDKNCWNESQNKKGRQVYLGAYDDEEAAARTYDLAALKYWGPETTLNFPLSNYEEELKEMEGESREEYIGSLRRKSSGFSRGISKYRGVARHHHNGRWEARIGRVFGNKYLYLGTYATQEEAATAYDMAAIEHRGLNAVTNFDLSRYIKWLKPNPSNTTNCPNTNSQQNLNNPKGDIDHNIIDGSVYVNPSPELGLSMQSHQQSSSFSETSNAMPPPCSGRAGGGGSGGSAPSALGLLLQSSKFKEMLERTSAEDCPSTPSESETLPRRSFPDDIQTYFDCHDSSNYTEGDDMIFGELNSFTSPVFQFELDV